MPPALDGPHVAQSSQHIHFEVIGTCRVIQNPKQLWQAGGQLSKSHKLNEPLADTRCCRHVREQRCHVVRYLWRRKATHRVCCVLRPHLLAIHIAIDEGSEQLAFVRKRKLGRVSKLEVNFRSGFQNPTTQLIVPAILAYAKPCSNRHKAAAWHQYIACIIKQKLLQSANRTSPQHALANPLGGQVFRIASVVKTNSAISGTVKEWPGDQGKDFRRLPIWRQTGRGVKSISIAIEHTIIGDLELLSSAKNGRRGEAHCALPGASF